jgi:IclR family transcriptional regulator, acetate operon repressor
MALARPGDTTASHPDAIRNLGISRALRLLELLAAEDRGFRITDLAEALQVNKAIAFRTLAALIEVGYVRQDPESQRYQATFKLAALGLRKLEASRIEEWAQEPLDRLAQTTRELVRLAVVDGESLRWIAKAQGSNSRLIVDPAAGADVILHATATGKAWLSTLDEESVRAILSERGLDPQTEHTRTDPERLLAELAEVRDRGYAMVTEEMDPGINAIATPIVVPIDGRSAVGTVSVAGPAVRVTPEVLEHFAEPLMATARELAGHWAIYRRQSANPRS